MILSTETFHPVDGCQLRPSYKETKSSHFGEKDFENLLKSYQSCFVFSRRQKSFICKEQSAYFYHSIVFNQKEAVD